VAAKLPAGRPFAVALLVMLVITLIGLVIAVLIPRTTVDTATRPGPPADGVSATGDISATG
jgi:hypothetical protein